MLKEKLSKLFKNDGNDKKKTENLVFLLIILIVTVIAINTIWNDETHENIIEEDSSKKLVSNNEERTIYQQDTLEIKLENILANMCGVGNINVLITYNETEEIIPIYNKKDKKSVTNEVDSSGGTRVVEELDTSQEVIYQNEEIIVQKTKSPKIEGAVIIATGANDPVVKTNIIQAVEAVTGLATHKIQVFEKKN